MIEPRSVATERGQWLFTGWRGWIVGVFAAIACLLAVASAVDVLLLTGLIGPGRGDPGFRAHATLDHPGWSQIDTVSDVGPAKAAGITPAMFVRFDQRYEAHAQMLVGRPVGVWLATSKIGAGRIGRGNVPGAGATLVNPRHLTLIAQPYDLSRPDRYRHLGNGSLIFVTWFCVALGLVAIVRGWGSIAALTFALGIFGFPLAHFVPVWPGMPWQIAAFVLACGVMNSATIGLVLLPAALYHDRIGRLRLWWLVVFGVIAVAVVVARTVMALHLLDEPRFVRIGDKDELATLALVMLCQVLGLYWAWRGSREALGADRGRFVALLAANVALLALSLADTALSMMPAQSASAGALVYLVQQALVNVLLPLTLAYAVLRHRVVDLGFVLNRTVVYGSVSVLLLGSFGLIEWGVEHWLPESWVRASVWIDAGAALLVYLAFHRVHEAVEHRIEHVFFRKWQTNEAILRRFVASAPHFEDERALARAFADELVRFSGEARVALYRRRERTHDAILERTAGSWDTTPRTLPVDDPAFALMRAERSPVDLADALTDLPGVLALPMLDHGLLAGLVLMDLKGNGALYRPDEVAVLGWAAHNVSLAMGALHAGVVESENRLLKAQLARLGSMIGDRLDHAEV